MILRFLAKKIEHLDKILHLKLEEIYLSIENNE